MAKLFDSPTTLLILLLVMVLLFGAPKLPGMARSLGQSLRIFKSEVTERKDDQPVPAGGSVEGRSAHQNQGMAAPHH